VEQTNTHAPKYRSTAAIGGPAHGDLRRIARENKNGSESEYPKPLLIIWNLVKTRIGCGGWI